MAVLLFVIVVTLLSLVACEHFHRKLNIPFAIIIAVIAVLFIYIPTSFLTEKFITPPSTEVKRPIISLQDNSFTQGSFILGTGHVETEMHYFYYQVQEDGGYSLQHIPCDDTSVYEGYTDAQVIEHKPSVVAYLIHFHFPSHYELKVPSGTILREYNLDSRY